MFKKLFSKLAARVTGNYRSPSNLMPETIDEGQRVRVTRRVNYIPLENNPEDILIKVQWVLENPKTAQQIVRNAHERLHWLCGDEYLWACNEVLRQITS